MKKITLNYIDLCEGKHHGVSAKLADKIKWECELALKDFADDDSRFFLKDSYIDGVYEENGMSITIKFPSGLYIVDKEVYNSSLTEDGTPR